jgi:PAS domain S-box-containing protein
MEESTPRLTQLLAEVAALHQQVASLSVQVQTQEAVLTTLQASLVARDVELARQHATLAELQDTLAEQGLENAELQQALDEQVSVQQAVEAERHQYQTLFDLAPDGYLVTNPVGAIQEANPAAARLFGMPAAHLLGKPLAGFVAREDAPRFHTFLHTLATAPSAAPVWMGGFQPPRRRAFLGELTVAIRQEAIAHGQRYHWLLRDITARVETEAALRAALAEQQRLEREAQRAAHFALLGRLAAGVSHEIRNPLGAVVLHVDLLEEVLQQPSPDSPDEVRDTLAEIKTNLARVDDLVQDYLSLVRVAAIERHPCDLGEALQTWVTEWQPLATGRGVRLCLDAGMALGVVAVHASTLRRALLNLVQNALDAMPQGGTLTLRGQRTTTAIHLQVQDTGSGIAATALAQIFEPLYTTKPGGTGLGLYIVQEIVAAHGGQITVESCEGHGTTFTLTLPVILDEASA